MEDQGSGAARLRFRSPNSPFRPPPSPFPSHSPCLRGEFLSPGERLPAAHGLAHMGGYRVTPRCVPCYTKIRNRGQTLDHPGIWWIMNCLAFTALPHL